MAAFAEKKCTPDDECDVRPMGNPDSGHAVGVSTEARKPLKTTPAMHRGLEQPATTLPTCCPRYPPGSTLLECRLEGDQPVAHVVQVPGDGSVATQKTCLLVETKQTEFGPLSRVVARTQEDISRQDSRECPSDGPITTVAVVPVATVTLVPVDCGSPNKFTALETIKGGSDKPSSNILDASSPLFSNETKQELPMATIDCNSPKNQILVRLSKQSPADCTSSLYPQAGSSPGPPNLPQSKIDQSGPKVSRSRESSHTCCCKKKSKPSKDEPSAMKKEKLDDDTVDRFSLRQVQGLICSDSKILRLNRQLGLTQDDPESGQRRNGLDPSDLEPQAPVMKGRRRVCLVKCLKPTDDNLKSRDKQKGQTELQCVLVPCSVVKQTEDKPRKGQIREPEPREVRKPEKHREDFMPTVEPEELVTRYREYVPPYLLSRYETCRSKRNGLQDECMLPVPRAVLELKRKEMMCRNEIERIDGPDDRCVY